MPPRDAVPPSDGVGRRAHFLRRVSQSPAGSRGAFRFLGSSLSGSAKTENDMDIPRLHAQVEETCINAWPALKEIFYDGWLIRLANGQTRRTNSVNVIGKGSRSLGDKIAYCEDIYRSHGQPPYFRILSTGAKELDNALDVRGYRREDETCTLFMNFRQHPPPEPDVGF